MRILHCRRDRVICTELCCRTRLVYIAQMRFLHRGAPALFTRRCTVEHVSATFGVYINIVYKKGLMKMSPNLFMRRVAARDVFSNKLLTTSKSIQIRNPLIRRWRSYRSDNGREDRSESKRSR